jgi:hypothetical protein
MHDMNEIMTEIESLLPASKKVLDLHPPVDPLQLRADEIGEPV